MIYTKCESVLSVRREERVCVYRPIHGAVCKEYRMMGRVIRVLRVPPSDGYWLLFCFEFVCIPGHVTTTTKAGQPKPSAPRSPTSAR